MSPEYCKMFKINFNKKGEVKKLKPELKFLSDEEVVKVHNLALDMLEDMGMCFQHEEAKEWIGYTR